MKDGGPAFPITPAQTGMAAQGLWQPPASPGMSLRDYFAAAALQGNISTGAKSVAALAHGAYAIADAMLTEREKGG